MNNNKEYIEWMRVTHGREIIDRQTFRVFTRYDFYTSHTKAEMENVLNDIDPRYLLRDKRGFLNGKLLSESRKLLLSLDEEGGAQQ